jgi:hypothetical protein
LGPQAEGPKQAQTVGRITQCRGLRFWFTSRLAGHVRILTKNETCETWKMLRPIRGPDQPGAIDPSEGFIRGSSGRPQPYPITGFFI